MAILAHKRILSMQNKTISLSLALSFFAYHIATLSDAGRRPSLAVLTREHRSKMLFTELVTKFL